MWDDTATPPPPQPPPPQTRSPEMIALLRESYQKLPHFDQKLLQFAHIYLGGNAALGGLIANSLCRRALNVTRAPIASSLPMAAMPFLTTGIMYTLTVSRALVFDEVQCPTCCAIRGGVVGLVCGFLHPISLAVPLNLVLAIKYRTTPLPEKGAMPRYVMDLTLLVVRKMRAVMLLQAVFGGYLAAKNYDAYLEMSRIAFGPREEQLELTD